MIKITITLNTYIKQTQFIYMIGNVSGIIMIILAVGTPTMPNKYILLGVINILIANWFYNMKKRKLHSYIKNGIIVR